VNVADRLWNWVAPFVVGFVVGAAFLLSALLLPGVVNTSGRQPLPAPAPSGTDKDIYGTQASFPGALKSNYALVSVFYATDRKEIPNDVDGGGQAKYGFGRGSAVTYGETVVSIPREHRMGQLESPSVWKLQFR